MPEDKESKQAFLEYLSGLFDHVDEAAYKRHMEGAQTYGSLKFLGADTLEMALEEVLDLINYARYTAVKIMVLQNHLAHLATAVGENDTTGAGAFIPMSETMKGFDKS